MSAYLGPARALLWETWTQTRVGFLSRLLVALALLALLATAYEAQDAPNGDALAVVRVLSFTIALLCALSGLLLGRSQDTDSGFPYYLGYVRPIPTWLLVTTPMVYRTIGCTALYVVPILIADLAFGLPSFATSAGLLMVPFTLASLAAAWWTDKKGIGAMLGWAAFSLLIGLVCYYTLHLNETPDTVDSGPEWMWSFAFSARDYLILLFASATPIAFLLVAIAKQRHGDPVLPSHASDGRPDAQATDTDWLADLYQTNCPTTSAKRAELWSEMNGSGLPVLARCLVAALITPMLWFISNLAGHPALWGIATIMVAWVPLTAAPTLGIVTKAGTAYMSTFSATRPLNTAWLAGAKIGVATISMIAGALVIAISFWFSIPLIDSLIPGMGIARENILDYFSTTPPVDLALSAFTTLVQFTTFVAFMATLHTIYALYLDRITYAVLVSLFYLAILWILVATEVAPITFAVGHIWVVLVAIALVTAYFVCSLVKLHVMRPAQLGGLVLAWAVYALAYFHMHAEAGSLDSDLPVEFIVFRVIVCLLSLTIFAMAPWSLAMIRHK